MKKTDVFKLILGFCLILLCSCQNRNHVERITPDPSQAFNVTILGVPGTHWNEVFENGWIQIKISPQIAVWSEDLEGNFLQTHFVTHKVAKQEWGNRVEFPEDQVYRVDALPIWYHRSGYPLSKKNPLADDLTGASPKGEFLLQTEVKNEDQAVNLYLEVNNSYDHSSEERKSLEGENGQASLIYRARIPAGFQGRLRMELLGHSSPPFSTGNIEQNFDHISTARDILSHCDIIIE